MDIDSKLLNARDASSAAGEVPDDASWLALATRAVELLGVALGRELIFDSRRSPSLGAGFSVWTMEARTPGPADVTVRAIVGADVTKEGLLVRAWIFHYVGGVRVGPRIERGLAPYRSDAFDWGELLDARLVASADGKPRWEIGEWDVGFTDDEWAQFERW